jgi:predicted transcriptional regulator
LRTGLRVGNTLYNGDSNKDKTTSESISHPESNYGKYVEVYRRLLLLNEENNLGTTLKNIQELLSFSEKIFSSSAVAEAFLYFCLHGASTAWTLQNELNMPEATVYRALKRLRILKIIVPALKVSKMKNSKGGPRPTIWSLEGASTEEVARAMRIHYKMLSPKFRIAEEVAQTILDEYVYKRNVSEISYKEIIIQVKELRIPFRTPDIAELAATYLHDKGVKVWR